MGVPKKYIDRLQNVSKCLFRTVVTVVVVVIAGVIVVASLFHFCRSPVY